MKILQKKTKKIEMKLKKNKIEYKKNISLKKKELKIQQNSIPILYDNKDKFNGIIKYLTKKTGGNIHDNGTIEATSNSFHSTLGPKNLLDFDHKSFFCVNQKNDVWICFDFKNKKIKLTNYSIESFSIGENLCNLKSWDIETSNDGDKWTKIDEQKNCPALNGANLKAIFDVRPNDFSRYVRLHQTDSTWGGSLHCVCFYCIEFYGYLIE